MGRHSAHENPEGLEDPAAAHNGAGPPIRRLAAISLHTSPLAQAGTGDAGGMNVYIDQTARRLAARGVEVEIFVTSWRARSRAWTRKIYRVSCAPSPRA